MKHISYKLPMEDIKVIEKVEFLRKAKLNEKCHLYEDYCTNKHDITIGEAVNIEVNRKGYASDTKQRPAIALLRVILSIRRSYNSFVRPRIFKLKSNADLNSFADLKRIVNSITKEQFFEYWNFRSIDRYNILVNMLNAIDKLKRQDEDNYSDYELINTWAKGVIIERINKDVFGGIRNVSVATVQHLRMNFGIDTSKPDLQVSRVLEREFNIKTSKVKVINYVKGIAEITGYKAIEIDQIFVNYGSGYYKSTGKPKKDVTTEWKGAYIDNGSKESIKKTSDEDPDSKYVKRLIDKFASNIEREKPYSFSEFYETFKIHVRPQNNVFEMFKYLMEEVITDKEINGYSANFLRRNDNKTPSYIYEFRSLYKEDLKENGITIWLRGNSISIDIRYIGFKLKTYKSVEQIKNDDIAGKYIERLKKLKYYKSTLI